VPKRRAVLDISASRLELTVLSGNEVASSHSQRVSIPEYSENWPRSLDSAAAQLASLVKSAGAAGLETTIIYQSPSSAVLVAPVHAGAGPKQARQAASLALSDAANRQLPDSPHDLERIWVDPDAEGPEAAPRQAHFLGIADTEEGCAALARLVKDAGLSPSGLIPVECLGVVAAVDAAIEGSKASGSACIAISCGEHVSTLVAATAGRLRFVRRIGIGSEMLVEALAREVRTSGPEGKTLTLDRAQAAELLFRNGIPSRGQPFDTELGIGADAVLPLVQPVLQRCIVEIKQSLRFGLDEKERGGAKLIPMGLGSRIGRLMQLIAEQCALTIEDKAAASPKEPSSTACGPIRQWMTGRQFTVRVLPSFMRRQQAARRVRRGMLVGFGAAAALIAFNAFNVRMELDAQLKRVEKARTNLESTRPITDLNLRMIAAQTGVANAKQRINARLSTSCLWDGAMVALSQCTPESVKINECHMTFVGGKPVCRITGQTPMPATGDANAVLRSFLDALGSVPIVKSTRLGATQRADSDAGPIQSFEMTITFVDLPAVTPDARPDIASASDTEIP